MKKKLCIYSLKLYKISYHENKKLCILPKVKYRVVVPSPPIPLLKAIGFNYDYADEKGPARDLRSGIPYDSGRNGQPIALLKVHDILATSGMDGIFPEGLQVAEIVQVDPLEEGAYFYELRAKPTAGNLDTLSLVFVMSPQGLDLEDMHQ